MKKRWKARHIICSSTIPCELHLHPFIGISAVSGILIISQLHQMTVSHLIIVVLSLSSLSVFAQPDLSPFLALAQCECLNEDDSHPLSSILEPKDVEAHLLSDTDAQVDAFLGT